MEGCPRSSMLSIDLKDSIPTDFTDSLKKYISDHYQEDPENYKHECQQLEQLRSACLHPGLDHSGCSILRRYFAQLQYLQSRFPMVDGGAVSIQFTWTDLYSEESISLADVRFEQSAILHNLGSLHSQLGAQEDRTGEEGMKVACTHFQAAAGVFQYLKNTVMVPLASMKLPWMSEDHFSVPFFDLASCVLQLYINILLGQAQECLLEKSILDGRKHSLIARISMQVYDYYQQALGILESLGSSYLGSKKSKMWTKAMKIKACHFTCVSYIHMSNHAHENQKFGEKVAYLKAADQKLKEAEKQSKGQPERTLELLQFMNDVVSNKLEGAVKDNDFIFHEVVPDLAALPVIKGASLVKPIPFQPCDPSVAGPDIFLRLIPMEAHSDSSIYSEEKAKLLRRYNASIEVKNKQLVQSLASLHIDDLLQPVETDSLPALLKEKHDSLSKDAVLLSQTEANIKESSKLSNDIEGILQIISSMLEEDKKKEQLLAKDARQATSPEKEEIRNEYDKCKEALVKANHTNNELVRVYNAHRQNLELIAGSEEQLLSALPSLNIIDSPVDDGAVQKLRDLIAKVEEMKVQRKLLEENLRNKLNEDDITGLLVTQDGNKMAFFDEQLKKHDTACSLIQANLDAQDKILSALTEANAKYAKTRQAVKENAQRREEVVQALILSYNTFCELQGKLSRGVDFYKQLSTTVKKLEEKCKDFFDNHNKVLDKLIEKKKAASEPTKPPSRPSAAKPDHLLRPQQPTMPPTSAMFIPGQPSGLMDPSSIPQATHPQLQQVPRQSIPSSYPRHVPPSSLPYSIPQSHIPADQAIHTPPRMSYPFPDNHRHMQVSDSGQYPIHGVSSAMPSSQGPQCLQYQNLVLPNSHRTNVNSSHIRPDHPHNVASYQQPDVLGGQRQLPGQSNVRPQVTSQSVQPPQPDLISQVRPQLPGQFQPTQQPRPFHIPESPQSSMCQLPPRPPLPTILSVPLEPLPPSSMRQPGQPTASQVQNFQPRSMAPSSIHQQMNPGRPSQLQIRPKLQTHQPERQSYAQPRQPINQPFQPGQPFQPDQIHRKPFHQGLQPQFRPHNSSQPPFRSALPPSEHFRPQLSQQHFRPQQAQELPPQSSQHQFPPQSPQSPVRPHLVQQPFRPQQPPQQFGLQRPPQQHINQPQQPLQQMNDRLEQPFQPQQPSQQHFQSQSLQPPLRPQQQQPQRQNQPFPPDQPPYQQFGHQQPSHPQKPSQQQLGSQQTSQLQQPVQFKGQQSPQGPLKSSQEPPRRQFLPNSLQQPMLISRPDGKLPQPLHPEQLSNKEELLDGLHPSFQPEPKSQQPLHPQQMSQQTFRPQLPPFQPSILDQSTQLQYQPEKNHPQALQPSEQNAKNNNYSSQKTFRPDLSSQQPFQTDQASQQSFRQDKISPQFMEPEQFPRHQFPQDQQQPSSQQETSRHNKAQPKLPPQSHFEMSIPIVAQQPVSQQRSEQGTSQVDQQPFRQPAITSTANQTSRPQMEPASPRDESDGGSQHQSVLQPKASGTLSLPKLAASAHSYPETGAFLANQTSLPSSYGSWPTSSLFNQGCRPFPSSVSSSDYLTSFSVALAQSQLSQYQNSSSQQQMQQFQQQLLLQQQQLILQQQEMLKQQQSQHHAHDSDQMQISLLLQQILQQQKQLTDLEMKIKDKNDQSKHEDCESAAPRSTKYETKKYSHEHQKGDKKVSSLPSVEKADSTSIDNQPSPIPSDLSESHKIVGATKADNKIPVNTFVPDYAAAGQWFADISVDKLDTKTKDSETKDYDSKNYPSKEEHRDSTIEKKKEDKNVTILKEENDISLKIENNNLKPDLFDPESLKANQEIEGSGERSESKSEDLFDLQEEGKLPIANNDSSEANGLEDSSRQEMEEQIKQIKDVQTKPSVFITGCFYEPGQVPRSPKEPPPCSQSETEDNKPSLLRQYGHYYASQISKIDQATNNSCINSDEEMQALVSAVKGFDLVVKSLSTDKRGCGYDGFTIEWRELERLQEYDSVSITAHAGTMNQAKNRYKDILPWDHTRVQLASKEENDYINASFVKDITPLSPRFIATQGPIAQTLNDFWLMVWEQQANIIVMLTREVEGNKLMCHQYWPIDEGHGDLYGPIRVSLKKVIISPLSVKRIMHVQHSDSHDTLVVTHLQFCGWPDKGVPESPVGLLSFADDVRLCNQQSLNQPEEKPIIVHCSAGVGRAGTFIILYAAIREFNANHEFVNIPRLVRNLRLQRKYMVQKKEQYEFCYKTLLFYARQFLNLELAQLTPQRRVSLNLGQLETMGVAEDGMQEANNKQIKESSDKRFIGKLQSDNSLDGDEKDHLELEQTIAEKYCKGTLDTDVEEKNKTKKIMISDDSSDPKQTEVKLHLDQHPGKVSIGVDKEVRFVKNAKNDSDETGELKLLENKCKVEKSSDNANEQDVFEQKCHVDESSENADGKKDNTDLKNINMKSVINMEERMTTNDIEESHETQESYTGLVNESKECAACDTPTESSQTKNEKSCNK